MINITDPLFANISRRMRQLGFRLAAENLAEHWYDYSQETCREIARRWGVDE